MKEQASVVSSLGSARARKGGVDGESQRGEGCVVGGGVVDGGVEEGTAVERCAVQPVAKIVGLESGCEVVRMPLSLLTKSASESGRVLAGD